MAKKTLRRYDAVEALKVDPVAVLSMIAAADVVGLGLMTEEEYDDKGARDPRTKKWVRLPGKLKAADLISLNQRASAATELLPYIYAKKAPQIVPTPVTLTDEQGRPAPTQPIIQLYVPDNGRIRKPHPPA